MPAPFSPNDDVLVAFKPRLRVSPDDLSAAWADVELLCPALHEGLRRRAAGSPSWQGASIRVLIESAEAATEAYLGLLRQVEKQARSLPAVVSPEASW